MDKNLTLYQALPLAKGKQKNAVKTMNEGITEPLYHYTSISALIGMLKSKELYRLLERIYFEPGREGRLHAVITPQFPHLLPHLKREQELIKP